MNTNLALATSQSFGMVKCDFWQDKEQNEFYMTREQIGSALEYTDPRVAITKIHDRHKDRLDKFSGVTSLVLPKGGTQNTTIYNPKGVYEICRWSRQDKANEFMDWVWDVIDNLRTGEMTLSHNNMTFTPQAIQAMISEQLELFKNDLTMDIDKRMNTVSNSFLYIVKLLEQNSKPLVEVNADWKRDMFAHVDEVLAQGQGKYKDSKVILQSIYTKMRNVYGIVWEQEEREFKDKYNITGKPRTMELISEKEQLRSIFEGIIEDIGGNIKPKSNIVYFPVNVEIDPIKAVITPLIGKRQDKSKGGNKTYQAVYKRMDVSWENRFSRYCKKYELSKKPSKSLLIKDNEKLFKMFKQVVTDMLSE